MCRPKVFCIGRNKTGTTTMAQALSSLGYAIGNQSIGESLFERWLERDFVPIIDFCRSADAFQDIPFSLDDTYKALDRAYPDAKFVLTVRNSPEEWFASLVRFHAKIIGVSGTPTIQHLKDWTYRGETGWLWKVQRHIFGIEDEHDLYQPTCYLATYQKHIDEVTRHFANRHGKLLILNVADGRSMPALCEFLGVEFTGQAMPHLNMSQDLPVD